MEVARVGYDMTHSTYVIYYCKGQQIKALGVYYSSKSMVARKQISMVIYNYDIFCILAGGRLCYCEEKICSINVNLSPVHKIIKD